MDMLILLNYTTDNCQYTTAVYDNILNSFCGLLNVSGIGNGDQKCTAIFNSKFVIKILFKFRKYVRAYRYDLKYLKQKFTTVEGMSKLIFIAIFHTFCKEL